MVRNSSIRTWIRINVNHRVDIYSRARAGAFGASHKLNTFRLSGYFNIIYRDPLIFMLCTAIILK